MLATKFLIARLEKNCKGMIFYICIAVVIFIALFIHINFLKILLVGEKSRIVLTFRGRLTYKGEPTRAKIIRKLICKGKLGDAEF